MNNNLDEINLLNFNDISLNLKESFVNEKKKNDKFIANNFNDKRSLNIDRYKSEIIEYYTYNFGNESIINKISNHIIKRSDIDLDNPYKFTIKENSNDEIINIYDDIKSDLISRITKKNYFLIKNKELLSNKNIIDFLPY